MGQTLSLYRLQQIDSQIDRLQGRIKMIQETLADDTELQRVKGKFETALERCRVAQMALDSSEKVVQEQVIKIEQTQADLYSGKNHSPKELQDLQNDVAALKRHLVTFEDQQINAMLESETAEAERQISQIELDEYLIKKGNASNDLLGELNRIKNELDRYNVERNAAAGTILKAELELYDKLRQQRRGVAVVMISENSCGACGTSLNRAQIQSARSAGAMMFCPSCGRILFAS